MRILYYNSTERLAILDKPSFPEDDRDIDSLYSEQDLLTLDEWSTYYIKVYGEKDDPLLDSSKFVRDRFHRGEYEINFQNYVGLTRIGNINLSVTNKKISDTLYDAMLGYIADKYADLVFSFDTPVGLESIPFGTLFARQTKRIIIQRKLGYQKKYGTFLIKNRMSW